MENEIKEVVKKQEETLVLVKKLWRAEKWRRFWMIFKYAIYLSIILGAFYFLTPYIPYIERTINLIQNLKNVQNPQELQEFLKQIK